MAWGRWGDPQHATHLSDQVLGLLRDGLGVQRPGPPVPDFDSLELPPSRVSEEVTERLAQAVGAEHVRGDAPARLRHTRGKSTPDLLRLRLGDTSDAPDLVVSPSSHEEVVQVLETCSQARVAVVPFGGGSSVVGGLAPDASDFAGLISLDLGRLDALLELDEESRLARLAPGLRGPEAEALLGARGYTLGHFPQSFQYATLGGFAAARSSGQASAGYGRFDERVAGLRVATPVGTLELGRAPRSAAGPDLRQLILGSEGAFGVITELLVAVSPAPASRVYEGWRFPTFAAGATVLRRLAQDGPRPTVLRLSDEAETALNLARPGQLGQAGAGGSLAIVGFEGSADEVAQRCEQAGELLRGAGGAPVPDAGESWERERYNGPYLRDALLDAGALVETLETVTFWSGIPRLYEAVSGALRKSLTAMGTPPVILCHVSHVYAGGASLYFTVACAQAEDVLAQWGTAKAAASQAILDSGGSISHHHGVGTDHREGLAQEVGELGVAVLRAVKSALDPTGILNPGVLVAR